MEDNLNNLTDNFNDEKGKKTNQQTTTDISKTVINEDENEMTMEELLKLQNDLNEKLYNREIVYVKVIDVKNDYVYVDIGEKNEGLIPTSDFHGFKLPNIGTNIVAILERKGNNEKSPTILSYRKAKETITLNWISKAFENKERVRGKVIQHVKGGYIVSINGLNAFMPLSLSEIGGSPKHYLPINAKIKFYITEFDPKNRKVIVSRRHVLEEDEKERRKKIISQISEGEVTRGVVSKIMENGMFVRFQGIEGFVSIDDIDWKNPKQAIKQYTRGQRIKIKILKIDREKQTIQFGIKQTKPNPLDILKRKFPIRSILKAKILEVNENAAKAHIIDDVYGTIAEQDYSYDGMPEKDSMVDVVVVGYDSNTYELKLSIKKFEQIENRKCLEQYTKQSPKITLGQLIKEEGK